MVTLREPGTLYFTRLSVWLPSHGALCWRLTLFTVIWKSQCHSVTYHVYTVGMIHFLLDVHLAENFNQRRENNPLGFRQSKCWQIKRSDPLHTYCTHSNPTHTRTHTFTISMKGAEHFLIHITETLDSFQLMHVCVNERVADTVQIQHRELVSSR